MSEQTKRMSEQNASILTAIRLQEWQPTSQCETCSKPLAGRGRCESLSHVQIGPRKVGQVWRERCTEHFYKILAIDAEGVNRPGWTGWSMTVSHDFGHGFGAPVVHCTPFNSKRDVLVAFARPTKLEHSQS